MTAAPKRKLIEVALPLEAINKESAREKSIRHGHPSTLHLWWARRPLAAARAVLFAQLVDDPSSDPERFPAEDDQRAERERLHDIIKELVLWENINNETVLAKARKEILASTGGNPPPILDPFAGGGTIPLEAQRLGLEAHASDLNPVAVLINKALIEIPPKFRDQPPVFPGKAESAASWKGAQGLAADVRQYGQWIRDEAEKRIGHLYPKAADKTVIAWIWARTVTCPNPACGIEMPLVRSWWLGRKKGKEAYIVPVVVPDTAQPSGQRVSFVVSHDVTRASRVGDGTVGRNGAECVACHAAVELAYVRAQGRAGHIGRSLMSIVTEGGRQRVYLPADSEHLAVIASVEPPSHIPDGELPEQALGFRVQGYGMTRWADLFTNRQLTALVTLCELVTEAREHVLNDALAAGIDIGERLVSGGTGADAYADAITTYLSLAVGRVLNKNTSLNGWDSSPKMEAVRGLFARQAVSMTWDFAEANVFGGSSGDFAEDLGWVTSALDRVIPGRPGEAIQASATAREFGPYVLSTDPPYYDNIGYSDLSDFFYVWHRLPLREVFPDLFGTVLVPKAEELIANPYRHDGSDGARAFFEEGFRTVFARSRVASRHDFPITIFYAFKQSESDDSGTTSTGWETLLDGMITSGWAVTSTWPIRSELGNRTRSLGSNALASSIVLSLRPRPSEASSIDRRGLITALRDELPVALRRLQEGSIAPVDLPQAAIGPGMAVFSRYASVIEDDGRPMTVRSALARINEILDQVLNEQEGDFDPTTRFAIAWYRQHGYDTGRYGDADILARARNTAVKTLDRDGVLTSRADKVTLLRPDDLDSGYDVIVDEHVGIWEALHHLVRLLESDGVGAAGEFLARAASRADGAVDTDLVKELAFLLFSIAEKNGWTKDALAFNSLATSWAEIVDSSRDAARVYRQDGFEFESGE